MSPRMGRIFGDPIVEAEITVRLAAFGGGEDLVAIDIRQPRQFRIAVRIEKIVPGPHRQVEDFRCQKIRADEAAGGDRRAAGPVALVVADGREIDDDHLRTGGLQRPARRLPQGDDRGTRLDPLSGRAADTRLFRRAGVRVGIDIHRRHAKTLAGQRRGSGERGVGGGTRLRGRRDGNPRLAAPEISARLRVVGNDGVEDFQHVGHGARVRHDDIHGRHQRPVAAHRDDAAARRIGAEPVVGRRRTAARPGFFAEPERREACGRRRARAVGRPRGEGGREIVGIVGGFGPAVDAALHAAIRHRRHVGQAHQHRARRPQPRDGKGIVGGDQIGKGGRARCDGQAAHLVAVLGGIGDAVERPEAFAALAPEIRSARLLEHCRVEDRHGIEGNPMPVEIGDPGEVGGHQGDAAGAAGLQRFAQVADRCFDDLHLAAPAFGCCCVMQCTPPPRANSSRASTETTRRPG